MNLDSNFQTQIGGFVNVKFSPKTSYGTQFISNFKTSITKSKSSLETRIANQPRVAKIFNINLSRLKLNEVSDLQSFFSVVRGSLNTFRFNDITDNTATNQNLLALDESSSNETHKVFQLAKTYKIVDYSSNIQTSYKIITKPIASSVKIFDNSLAIDTSTYTVDESTGIVTFSSPQVKNRITATFNFDTHVRFDMDQLSIEHSNDGYKLSNAIKIVEIIDF